MRVVESNDGRLDPADLQDTATAESLLQDELGSRQGWGPVLRRMKRMKLIPPLVLNKESWVAFSSSSMIRLGIQPTPDELKNTKIFEGEGFDYHDDVTYKYGHELSHRLSPVLGRLSGNQGLLGLYDALLAMRRHNKSVGITALGGISTYQQQGEVHQATEDLVELVHMYLWGADYFERYFSFLASEDPSALRAKSRAGLTNLKPQVGAEIKRLIRTAVTNFAL